MHFLVAAAAVDAGEVRPFLASEAQLSLDFSPVSTLQVTEIVYMLRASILVRQQAGSETSARVGYSVSRST